MNREDFERLVMTPPDSHLIAVSVCESSDGLDATRVAEVFLHANQEGCDYRIVPVPYLAGSPTEPTARFRTLIVPPLSRWMGMSVDGAMALWMRQLVAHADHVVGIGTGAFLLAAAGALDGHTVVADPNYSRELATFAPRAVVHSSVTALRDRRLTTATAGCAVTALITSLVAEDYGVDAQHRVASRILSLRRKELS